jgi:hypothetical protein
LLKNCFHLTLQTYVESFFANTMMHGIKDPVKASKVMEEDYHRLVIFFNSKGFAQYSVGSFEARTVNRKLHILQCLSRLLNPVIAPDDTVNDIQYAMKEFGCDAGTVAVFHLAGLRRKHSGVESIEWLRAVAQAERAIQREGVDHCKGESARNKKGETAIVPSGQEPPVESSIYKLPDLRNSKFLSNVRPAQKEVYRRISAQSLAMVEKSTLLLTAPRKFVRVRIAAACVCIQGKL